MKVKDLQGVIRRLGAASFEPSGGDEAFQSFVQRRKAEHHRRAEAGASVTSSLDAEVERLRLGNGSGTGGGDDEGCQSSLDFLRRHARCLALVIGWLETTQATAEIGVVAGARAGVGGGRTCSPEKNKNIANSAVPSQHELLALVKTILTLATSDLGVVLDLSQTAQRKGNKPMFHR